MLQANLIATEVLWEHVSNSSPGNDRDRALIAHVFVEEASDSSHAVTALSMGYQEWRTVAWRRGVRHAALMETLGGHTRAGQATRGASRAPAPSSSKLFAGAGGTHLTLGRRRSRRDMRRSTPGAVVGRIGSTVVAYIPAIAASTRVGASE